MRIGTTFSSRGHGGAGVALAGFTALTTACASGAGTPPLTGVGAEALFAGLTGAWVADKSTGTRAPKLSFQSAEPDAHFHADNPEQARQIVQRRLDEELQRMMPELRPILEVWVDRPSTLIVRVDEDGLVYMPTPGRKVEVPMSGEWIWQDPERRSVRARVFWDGDRLTLERRVGSRGRVRSILEIVDGRLQIRRTIRVPRLSARVPPYVLMYDRDGGGE